MTPVLMSSPEPQLFTQVLLVECAQAEQRHRSKNDKRIIRREEVGQQLHVLFQRLEE